jgi:hypothetical protein
MYLMHEICTCCGTHLIGKYCHECGQKRISNEELSIKVLLSYFFDELFLWRRKFLKTVPILLAKPGNLTLDYVNGNRKSHLSPFRLYFFISLVVFLLLKFISNDIYYDIMDVNMNEWIRTQVTNAMHSSNMNDELFAEKFGSLFNDTLSVYLAFILFVFSIAQKLIYWRRREYYFKHFVFSLHFFSFFLICSAFYLIVNNEYMDYVLLVLIPAIYLHLANRRVYGLKGYMSLLYFIPVFLSFLVSLFVWFFGSIYLNCLIIG